MWLEEGEEGEEEAYKAPGAWSSGGRVPSRLEPALRH